MKRSSVANEQAMGPRAKISFIMAVSPDTLP